MSQLSKIEKHLQKHAKTGISPKKLASLSRIPVQSVYKRVYDLRVVEGVKVKSSYRNVNGQRKMFYSIAS